MQRSITELHTEFQQTIAASQLIPDNTDADRARWERAQDRCCKIAKRITRTPAQNIEEMLLKIRAATWSLGEGEEFNALSSLRGDLQRLRKPPKTDCCGALP